MREYLIGMHGQYNQVKFKRDFIESEFTGIELCNFDSMTEIKKIIDLKKLSKENQQIV